MIQFVFVSSETDYLPRYYMENNTEMPCTRNKQPQTMAYTLYESV